MTMSHPEDQTHPLQATDRAVVDRLLAARDPGDDDIVDLARLLIRYRGFPGSQDLRDDLEKTLRLWDLDEDSLNRRARRLWESGHRPGAAQDPAVGSGFDTADQPGA
jgi:hypothetical protein